jgi:hypothetical protein
MIRLRDFAALYLLLFNFAIRAADGVQSADFGRSRDA